MGPLGKYVVIYCKYLTSAVYHYIINIMNGEKQERQKFSVNPLKLWRDLKDAFCMFFAAICGKYPFPKRSFIWLLLFFVYAIIPFDLIPDPLIAFLGLGAADDLLVLVYVLNKMSPDLEKFRFFKNSGMRKNITEAEIVKDEKDY